MVLADKGFDADERVLIPLPRAGKVAVIPPKAKRKAPRNYDPELYKARRLTRKLLRHTQTLLRHRHTLRQNRTQLPGRHSLRRHAYPVNLMTGPSPDPSVGFAIKMLRPWVMRGQAGGTAAQGVPLLIRAVEGTRATGRREVLDRSALALHWASWHLRRLMVSFARNSPAPPGF